MNKVFACFSVPGVPCAKARPRVNTNTGRAYTPAKTKQFEELVKFSYWRQCGRRCTADPLVLGILFKMPIPQKTPEKTRKLMLKGKILPAKRPDIDNLIKAIMDGLNGSAYQDDNQIIELTARKVYGEEPETVVTLSTKKM